MVEAALTISSSCFSYLNWIWVDRYIADIFFKWIVTYDECVNVLEMYSTCMMKQHDPPIYNIIHSVLYCVNPKIYQTDAGCKRKSRQPICSCISAPYKLRPDDIWRLRKLHFRISQTDLLDWSRSHYMAGENVGGNSEVNEVKRF